jgi:uncharacterized DUF497 family protein
VDDELRFEWDAAKAQANLAKHGVSFEEASTVFYSEEALIDDDQTTPWANTASSSSVGLHREGSCW